MKTPNPEKKAESSPPSALEPETKVDNSGPGKTELEVAIRKAMALAILAGDDARALELGALLKPRPSADKPGPLKLVR